MLSIPDQRTLASLGEEVPHGIMGVAGVGPWGPCVGEAAMEEDRNTAETGDSESLPRLQMPRSLGLDTSFPLRCGLLKNSNEFFLLSENVQGYLCLFVRRFIQFQKCRQSTFDSHRSVGLGIGGCFC